MSSSSLFTILESSPQDFLSYNSTLYDSAVSALKDLLDPIAGEFSVFEEISLELDVHQIVEQARYIIDGILESQSGQMEVQGNEDVDEKVDIEPTHIDKDDEGDDDDTDEADDINREDESNDEESNIDSDINSIDKDKSEYQAYMTPDVHGLNDGFFSIDHFNKMTKDMENEQTDDDIDYNLDPDDLDLDEDLDNANEIRYNDFFAPPALGKKFKRKFSDTQYEVYEKDLTENESEPPDMSKFEKKQALLKQQIHELEQENIEKKKWTLTGEARAKDRPMNSLLEEDLEFERGSKPVPVITQQVTHNIEEIIKSRIIKALALNSTLTIQGLFDDVLKQLPETELKKSTPYELDDSKSKISLAELYEDDYVKTPKIEKNIQHEEIENLWKQISYKLDSLSSWHYTPKPPVVGLEVLTCAPTIELEDSRPDASSAATQFAPQEIYNPSESKQDGVVVMKSGIPVSKDEMSKGDKRRVRRRQLKKKQEILRKIGKNKETLRILKKGGVTIIGRNGEKKTVDGKVIRERKAKSGAQLKL